MRLPLLLVILAAMLVPHLHAQPRLGVTPDFMNVRRFAAAEWDTSVIVTNHGDQPLILTASITYSDSTDWLILQPDSLHVLPQTSDSIRLHFATTQLPVGIYYATIQLDSNDPIQPQFYISIILRLVAHDGCQIVLPNNGYLTAELPQEADTTLGFFLLNIGDADCELTASALDDWLTIEPDQSRIEAESSAEFVVRLHTTELPDGDHVGTIAFADQAHHTYFLHINTHVTPICLRPAVDVIQDNAAMIFILRRRAGGNMPVLTRIWQRYGASAWELRYAVPVSDSLYIPFQLISEEPNWFRFQTVCRFGELSAYLELGPFIYPSDIHLPAWELETPRSDGFLPNVPNPFNPHTLIRFQLSQPEEITLRIFDIHGRLIKTLLRAELAAGTHQTAWNGMDEHDLPVASGVYPIVLETLRQTWHTNLILLR